MALDIAYIVGSTSAESINRRLATALIRLAGQHGGLPEEFQFTEVAIGDLALYNRDLDDAYPQQVVDLKARIARSDGLLIVTPEYNRSIPGALKNALDWASRPYGDNALAGVPTGIVGASPGAAGTSMAQQHLRNILAYLDAPTLGQPEVFITFDPDVFGEDGEIGDADTREFLADWLTAFHEWATRFARE